MRTPTSVALVALSLSSLAAAQTAGKPGAESGQSESGVILELPGSHKLRVSGELRWRAEHRLNYDFRDDAGSDPLFVDQRARLALDFTVNEAIRAFAQLQDARTFGEEVNTIDRSADGFDLHQGFIDWTVCTDRDGRLRIGRQEISLGDQRLVSPLNWATQGRSFDGARFDVDIDAAEQFHGIAFATIIRQEKSQMLNQGSYFGGLQVSGHTEDKMIDGDVYLFLLVDDETMAGGTANRWTLGTRIAGRHSGFDGGFEGAFQFGEQDGADVPFGDCYALHFGGGYTFDATWSPRVGAEFNVATGNDPTTTDNERFNNLFPLAHAYFGYMDFALWENISHFSIAASAKPSKKTTLKLAWHNFHSAKTTDVFGGPAGRLSAGGAGGASHMGDEIDLTCRHDLGDSVWGEAGIGLLLAGDGIRDANAGFDDNALFFYYMMGLRF